jgi:hypothetical protein
LIGTVDVGAEVLLPLSECRSITRLRIVPEFSELNEGWMAGASLFPSLTHFTLTEIPFNAHVLPYLTRLPHLQQLTLLYNDWFRKPLEEDADSALLPVASLSSLTSFHLSAMIPHSPSHPLFHAPLARAFSEQVALALARLPHLTEVALPLSIGTLSAVCAFIRHASSLIQLCVETYPEHDHEEELIGEPLFTALRQSTSVQDILVDYAHESHDYMRYPLELPRYVQFLPVASEVMLRNRRALHNWQCVCVLLASYRANAHSPIRDSILSLMRDVMFFVDLEDMEIVRGRKQ